MVKRRAQLYQAAVMREISFGAAGASRDKAIEPHPQKKGWRWQRIRSSPPASKQPEFNDAKHLDWQMLKLWAELWLILLKYLCCCFGTKYLPQNNSAQSGFERYYPLGYTYAHRGEQKLINLPRKRGRRLSILKLWQPQVSFDYGLVLGSFRSERYLNSSSGKRFVGG